MPNHEVTVDMSQVQVVMNGFQEALLSACRALREADGNRAEAFAAQLSDSGESYNLPAVAIRKALEELRPTA